MEFYPPPPPHPRYTSPFDFDVNFACSRQELSLQLEVCFPRDNTPPFDTKAPLIIDVDVGHVPPFAIVVSKATSMGHVLLCIHEFLILHVDLSPEPMSWYRWIDMFQGLTRCTGFLPTHRHDVWKIKLDYAQEYQSCPPIFYENVGVLELILHGLSEDLNLLKTSRMEWGVSVPNEYGQYPVLRKYPGLWEKAFLGRNGNVAGFYELWRGDRPAIIAASIAQRLRSSHTHLEAIPLEIHHTFLMGTASIWTPTATDMDQEETNEERDADLGISAKDEEKCHGMDLHDPCAATNGADRSIDSTTIAIGPPNTLCAPAPREIDFDVVNTKRARSRQWTVPCEEDADAWPNKTPKLNDSVLLYEAQSPGWGGIPVGDWVTRVAAQTA